MVAKTIDSLKQKQASGEISAEKFQEELGKLMFRDASGKFWTVDFQTGHWVYYDGAKWVEGNPPLTLKGTSVDVQGAGSYVQLPLPSVMPYSIWGECV